MRDGAAEGRLHQGHGAVIPDWIFAVEVGASTVPGRCDRADSGRCEQPARSVRVMFTVGAIGIPALFAALTSGNFCVHFR